MMARPLALMRLRAHHACPEYCDKFAELFGDSVLVTEALCVKHSDDFPWAWAGVHLLSEKAYSVWILEEDQITSQLYAAQQPLIRSSENVISRINPGQWTTADYNRRLVIDVRFTRIRDAVRRRFNPQMARAWARAYVNDHD